MTMKERVQQYAETVQADPEFYESSRRAKYQFALQVENETCLFHVEASSLHVKEEGWNDSWDFTIQTDELAWSRFMEKMPPPNFQHLLPFVLKVEGTALTGNRMIAMQHIRSLNRIFQVLRECDSP
ncbi:hypothetical protein [Alkalicoccus halolimnae]|uniref:SCP2 domain-containing protein n=1 Tax=Alkalicoccus halolimnae TaxID=1667239 RepID=A0A5C7F637_9BACI|nr:hypothetical protein [Alkalicoccus halolimnae]TXF85473.1 hypothetical protein FTX54_07715 [Alkalicoccus halolimnae]